MPKINGLKLPGLKSGMGGTEVLNAIREDASAEYQARIPVATQENIQAIGNALTNYTPGQNEFISALINRIGLVVISNKLYSNPLREFKRGMLQVGDSIEEIFVDIASAQKYSLTPDPTDNGDVFAITRPDVKTRFHKINRQDYYPLTITQSELIKAFTSLQQLEDFISKCFEALYTGANLDEFLLMKNLVFDYNKEGKFYDVVVPAVVDAETGKEFATICREYSNNLTFMKNIYNEAEVYTHTPQEDQVILIRSDYEAKMSVEVLAYAFNMSKADFLSRVIIVDDFGGDETDDTVAILIDKSWFMIWDQKFEMAEQYNAKHLYWNYFLHIWQLLSTSEFANAIRFKIADALPSITSVTVYPGTASVLQGATQQFEAVVVGSVGVNDEVAYTVTGAVAKAVDTVISSTGKLTVGEAEANTTLTVTATSEFDDTKHGSATVTVVRGS